VHLHHVAAAHVRQQRAERDFCGEMAMSIVPAWISFGVGGPVDQRDHPVRAQALGQHRERMFASSALVSGAEHVRLSMFSSSSRSSSAASPVSTMAR
jgi:hypothetical protein